MEADDDKESKPSFKTHSVRRTAALTFMVAETHSRAVALAATLRSADVTKLVQHREKVTELRNAVFHDLLRAKEEHDQLVREGKELPPDLAADIRALTESYESIMPMELVHERQKVKIARVPGHGLLRVLGHFSPKQFRELLLEPRFADMSHDYAEQVAKGDRTRARMMRVAIPLQLLWIALQGALGGVLVGALSAIRKSSQAGNDE